jgi:ferredoxin
MRSLNMVITDQKPIQEILDSLRPYNKVFLVGCGECATVCKTGGEAEIAQMKKVLEENSKVVTGSAIPQAPCLASQIKIELAKNMKALRESQAILILACGLGVQSVKDNDRLGLVVLPGCDTRFLGVVDAKGNLYEKCSACGECVLGVTAGICPITLCPKGLLNGPCGGMDKGKCEVDKDKDCAWVLIYKELDKQKKLAEFKKIRPAKDFNKTIQPRSKILAG